MRERRRAKLLLWLLAFLALAFVPNRPARAQVPNAFYEDARGIIEDLIQKEVAQSVVPNLICRTVQGSAFAEELKKPAPDDKVLKAQLPLLQYYPRTLQRIFRRRFAALRAAAVDESAGAVGHIVYVTLQGPTGHAPPGDPAPANSLAVKLAGGDDKSAESAAQTSGEKYSWVALDEDTLYKCVKVVRKWYEDDQAEVSLTPLDAACSQTNGTPGSRYACDIALAVRALLLRKASLAEEHLIKAAAALIGEMVLPELGGEPQRVTALDNVTLALRQFLYDDAKTVDQLVDALLAGVAPAAPAGDPRRERLRATLKGLERLRTQWKIGTFAGTQKLDLAYFVKEISAPSGALGALCKPPQGPPGTAPAALPPPAAAICAQIERQREALGGTLARGKVLANLELRLGEKLNLWSIVQLASRGEYGDVASQVIGAFFSSKTSQEDETAIGSYRRFAEAVVRYVLDQADEHPPSEATRAAFREAAVEVLQELSQGGGIDHGTASAIIRPDLSLRLSWNPAYVNEGSSSSRVVASASLLNFRKKFVYTDAYYLAGQLSLVDPLAPLSELAQRPTSAVSYENGSRLAANVVSPRLDMLFGVPALSKHLVFGAGLSLRAAAPFRVSDQSTCQDPQDERPCYRYKFFWNKTDGVRDMSRVSFLEFGFAIKYLL